MRLPSVALVFFLSTLTSAQSPQPSPEAELAAVPSADHPYAGFWKANDCTQPWGLAISPAAKPGLYSVSFCGPGGCFTPGTYRPDTTLVNDSKYWVIDLNTMEVGGCGKYAYNFERYVRCPGREVH